MLSFFHHHFSRCFHFALRRRALDAAPAPRKEVAAATRRKPTKKIPVLVYKRDDIGAGCRNCSICLEDFVEGEKVRVLPRCEHTYHRTCIDRWLGESTRCPLCRARVVKRRVRRSDGGNASSRNMLDRQNEFFLYALLDHGSFTRI